MMLKEFLRLFLRRMKAEFIKKWRENIACSVASSVA